MREPPPRPRTRLAAAALVLAFVASSGPAPAEERVFAVGSVAVDETAADAREARRAAVVFARREAWRRLIDRMATGDASRVPEPGAERLEAFVQSLEFADEKIEAGRYRASIAVRFRADDVLTWLADSGAPHAPEPLPVMLVLPVLRTPDADLLWADDNPWLAAWRRRPVRDFAVEILAPVGDLDDILAIDAGGALAGDWTKMEPLARRYAADGVLVAVARPSGGRIDRTLTWRDGPEGRDVPSGETAVYGADWPAAVDAARRSVDDLWTAAAVAPEGREAVLIADIPIRGLADWVDIRNRLERPATLARFLPLVVATDRVRVRLHYVGAIEDLSAGLRGAGLELASRDGGWILLSP